MSFYTYLWLRQDGTPYYVGKGMGRRAFTNHAVQGIYRPKDDARIFVQFWADEQTALEMEKWYIRLFGRKDLGTGILRNRTDGGEGGDTFSGRKHSEETKQKMRKPKSAIARQRMSAAMRGKGRRERSESHRRNLSSAMKGKPKSVKQCQAMSEAAKVRVLRSIRGEDGKFVRLGRVAI